MCSARMLAAALAAALVACASPVGASAATAQEAIAALNAQRAAHGLPGGIVEMPSWSEGCVLHNAYAKRNGLGPNPHDEVPGLPGYTALGDEAANSAVLGRHGYRADGRNPWEDAPLHLAQLLAPELAYTGYAGGCMWTWPGYVRRAVEPALWSYPGDRMRIYPDQLASEAPFAPGDFVGLPQPTVTGPHLLVLAEGTGAGRLASAHLTGPDGPVTIRTVDNHTVGPLGDLGRLLPPGGIIIPSRPLREHARYRAHATFVADTGERLQRAWSFTTTATAVRPPASSGSPPFLLLLAWITCVAGALQLRRGRILRRRSGQPASTSATANPS